MLNFIKYVCEDIQKVKIVGCSRKDIGSYFIVDVIVDDGDDPIEIRLVRKGRGSSILETSPDNIFWWFEMEKTKYRFI